MKVQLKTFEGHKGIPGHQGGSLPRAGSWVEGAVNTVRESGNLKVIIQKKGDKFRVHYYTKGASGAWELNPHWSEVSSMDLAFKKGNKYLGSEPETSGTVAATGDAAIIDLPVKAAAKVEAPKQVSYDDVRSALEYSLHKSTADKVIQKLGGYTSTYNSTDVDAALAAVMAERGGDAEMAKTKMHDFLFGTKKLLSADKTAAIELRMSQLKLRQKKDLQDQFRMTSRLDMGSLAGIDKNSLINGILESAFGRRDMELYYKDKTRKG